MKNKHMTLVMALLVIAVSIASPSEEEQAPKKNVMILQHATLIDGNGGEPVSDVSIVIERDKIVDIIRSSLNSASENQNLYYQ